MTVGRRSFVDDAKARSALTRLERLGSVAGVMDAAVASADPDRALMNIDRWVGFDGDAPSRLESLVANPAMLFRLAVVVGASQPLADVLVRNPELGQILGDPDELARPVEAEAVAAEASELAGMSISFLHGLDRFRHVKNRTMLRIVWNDLVGDWEPEAIWLALSNLADGILEATARWVWRDLTGAGSFPIAVLAMGKHGSKEVNYSSDLDLVFVADDDADLAMCEKFCGRFVRAMEGKMGRGALYRIDLRLRPMGGAGPVLLGKSATLKYYESYSEPWETQALIRCRTCAGDHVLGRQVESALNELVYRGARSDVFLDGILDAKRRYESEVFKRGEAISNIKLGPGGIRDIEFIVQMHQLALGNQYAELQGASVADAITALKERDVLLERTADHLLSSYRFYRQVEHRIQLRQDLQKHTIPSDAHERAVLARLSGFASWSGADAELRRRRAIVREILERNAPALANAQIDEKPLTESLGIAHGHSASVARKLVASSDDPRALLAEAVEDPATASRLRLIVERAPRVVSDIAFHTELWDIAFGEQVETLPEDDDDPGEVLLERMRSDDWQGALETGLRRETALAALKCAFHGDVERTFAYLTAMAEAALLGSLDRLGGESIDVVGLGRLGSREPTLGSDWDVMLLCTNPSDQQRAERIGQDWLRFSRKLALASGSFPLDARLRPEGSSGLVVRSVSGFEAYAAQSMETWERLAYTRARSLRGNPRSDEVLRTAWAEKEWTWEAEQEALRMRRRVQAERMRAWEASRDLKLGEGYMLDIEWLVAILKLRHAEVHVEVLPTHETVHRFCDAGLLHNDDARALSGAALLYAHLRNTMFLLDFESDSVLPENPEKLALVAEAVEAGSANELLAKVAEARTEVSRVFAEVISG